MRIETRQKASLKRGGTPRTSSVPRLRKIGKRTSKLKPPRHHACGINAWQRKLRMRARPAKRRRQRSKLSGSSASRSGRLVDSGPLRSPTPCHLDIAEPVDRSIEARADHRRGLVLDDDRGTGDRRAGREVAAIVDRDVAE